MTLAHSTSTRGATLIEVVVIIAVLALAIPPALDLLDSSAASRADSINTTRAALLATTVMEQVLADVHSSDPALGFDALSDEAAYVAGLRTRLTSVTSGYAALRMSYQVDVGPLAQADGTVSGSPELDVFRSITVTARYPGATGGSIALPVSAVVTDLGS